MARLVELGLERLRKHVLEMAELALRAVSAVVDAQREGSNVLEQLRAWSDELNLMATEAEDMAVGLLARYQPMASDLRLIKSCMKVAYDFSRCGRYAYDVSHTLAMFPRREECEAEVVDRMAQKTLEMLNKSSEAFKKGSVELARSLSADDDMIDRVYERYLTEVLLRPGQKLECVVSNLLIARHLERIADHACYIAESVTYMVTGRAEEIR